MQTVWEYSDQTEAQRVIHVAHGVANGFFRLNHFTVVPYDGKPHPDNVVTLPDLPYLNMLRFWSQCAKVDISTFPIKIPNDITLPAFKFPELDYSKLQKDWAKNEKAVMAEIYKLIPSKKDSIKKLIIWPTAFGTGCSFNLIESNPGTVYIWIRHDQGISAIVEGILTSLTRNDVYGTLGGLWQESEIIVDWLLTYSPLSQILDSSQTLTIKHTRNQQNASFVAKSEAFLQKIGAPTVTADTFSSLDLAKFSPQERKVFQLLITKSPNIVSFDELSSEDPENFSLYAVSKTIQRLRDRLEQNGISGSYIQTKRGEGYLLVN